MLLEHQEEHTIEHSMEVSDLFESIAQELQNNDELDMSYDEIVEHLEGGGHHGYIDLTFRIIVNSDKKKITDIY